MLKISTAGYVFSAMIIMLFSGTGCNKLNKAKTDEFALSFALKYLSEETITFNDAVSRCYPELSGDYPMPKMSELSIDSCTVSEWQGVKSYHYSVAYKVNNPDDVKNNSYGENLHGDGSFLFGFRKTVFLTFVVEADDKGNLRVKATPVWRNASGKSVEEEINHTKRVIFERTGRYP